MTIDAQPSPVGGTTGVIVFVTGLLYVDEETTPLKYSQVFHLQPAGGSWWVLNDLFRLNYS